MSGVLVSKQPVGDSLWRDESVKCMVDEDGYWSMAWKLTYEPGRIRKYDCSLSHKVSENAVTIV